MSGLTDAELADAQAAIGRTATRLQRLDPESLRRFSVAVGGDADRAAPTPLAHWAWFLDAVPDAGIGEDGHPTRGGFLPAVPGLPRRMFAATLIRFEAPLLLDEIAEAAMRIADVRHKRGRTGDLLFVEIERTISQAGTIRIVEQQTVVYRAGGDDAAPALPIAADDAAVVPATGALWQPTPFHLFRFSAATFNGHRIHYDLPYATAVEGYPALIVHGPFAAAKLAELAARDGPLASFAFRAQAPLFVNQPVRLVAAGEGEFHAVRCDGATATIAKATYR